MPLVKDGGQRGAGRSLLMRAPELDRWGATRAYIDAVGALRRASESLYELRCRCSSVPFPPFLCRGRRLARRWRRRARVLPGLRYRGHAAPGVSRRASALWRDPTPRAQRERRSCAQSSRRGARRPRIADRQYRRPRQNSLSCIASKSGPSGRNQHGRWPLALSRAIDTRGGMSCRVCASGWLA